MSRPLPQALLGAYEREVYRCACGAWCHGLDPCETCVDLAFTALTRHRRG